MCLASRGDGSLVNLVEQHAVNIYEVKVDVGLVILELLALEQQVVIDQGVPVIDLLGHDLLSDIYGHSAAGRYEMKKNSQGF